MIYEEIELTATALEEASSPEKVEKIVVYILESNHKTDSKNTMCTDDIKKKYKELQRKNADIVSIPENSLATYTSILASKSESKIRCLGRRKGYFITLVQETPTETLIETPTETSEKGKLSEKDLYPALQQWMKVSWNAVKDKESWNDISVIDISAKRGNDKWQNPDLLCVKEIECLGETRYEITTVEVKPSKQDWTMYIFEAVSHSLFSNKAYFAFLKDNDKRLPDEMILYALRLGIGIITITIEDQERSKITTSEKLVKALADGSCIIREEVPAPYHVPDISLQKQFLEGLEIRTISDLRQKMKNG